VQRLHCGHLTQKHARAHTHREREGEGEREMGGYGVLADLVHPLQQLQGAAQLETELLTSKDVGRAFHVDRL
jgi:hypothetical protein